MKCRYRIQKWNELIKTVIHWINLIYDRENTKHSCIYIFYISYLLLRHWANRKQDADWLFIYHWMHIDVWKIYYSWCIHMHCYPPRCYIFFTQNICWSYVGRMKLLRMTINRQCYMDHTNIHGVTYSPKNGVSLLIFSPHVHITRNILHYMR